MAIRILLLILLSLNFAYADELKIITAEEFVSANPSPERQKIIDFIVHQFDGKVISQAELDKASNNIEAREMLRMARFQIVNQQLYVDSASIHYHNFINYLHYFQKLITKYKINDVDFVIYVRDEIPPNEISKEIISVPSFMMSKNLDHLDEQDKFLLPDAHIIAKTVWKDLATEIEEAKLIYPWHSKINKAFWLGATTGGEAIYEYNIKNFDNTRAFCCYLIRQLQKIAKRIRTRCYLRSVMGKYTCIGTF